MRALVTVTVLVLGLYGYAQGQTLQVPQKYCGAIVHGQSQFFFPVPNDTTIDQCRLLIRRDALSNVFDQYQAIAMCMGRDHSLQRGTPSKDQPTPPVPDECGWK